MFCDIVGLGESNLAGERAKYAGWKEELLVGPSGKSALVSVGAGDGQCWEFWVPAASLTKTLCWYVLHPICVGPSGRGPTSLSVLITFPPSLFPSPFQRNLDCLFLGNVEEGWREALLSLKMFLLNILILPRHQSLYFPFSPNDILRLRQKAQNSLAA